MKTNWKTMEKRVLSFLMAFAMILSMAQAISPAALVKAAEETESATYPSITAVDQYDNYDTFTISTAEEFAALATNVNAGKTYEGKTVLVTADLDFSAYKDTYWTPIGIATGNYAGTHPFKGHFDGQLHHFKNIDMKFTGNRKGLFGFAEGAVFENIILDEGTLTTVDSRLDGVLCAAVDSCTFRNIENHVSFVDGSSTLYDLWNIGLVSHCRNTSFEAVVNYGSIKGNPTGTGENGGLMAWGANNSTVSHCYMAGTVTGKTKDILGRGRGTTTNSYYVTPDDTGTISKADFASGQTAWNLNTLSGTQENASIWFATENGPVLRATDTTSVSNVDQYDKYDTFTISTAKEFADLATNVNAGYFYEGKTVLVTADLDFSAYKDTFWTPIGIATGNYTGTHPFKGHFDGQFHHFKNINMKFTGARQGLFGFIDGAIIENIILDEGTLTTVESRWPGLLSSQATGATIRNIENHVSLVDSSNYGYWNAGIVSHCKETTFEAVVNYGSWKGNATAIQENGGFMSWGAWNSPVNHCYMAGTVTGTSIDILGRGRGTTTNSYYLTPDDNGTITKANFVSGKTAWNLNTFTGTKENAGLWSTTENGPVLNPDEATYEVKVSKFDKDGNALGEATYYCNQGDTFTLDTTGFKIPACTLNGATLDGTSFTVPKGESVVTIVETRTDFVISPAKVNKLEAEYGDLVAGTYGELGVNNNHTGYSGTGFVDHFWYNPGAYVKFPIDVQQAGTYVLKIGYANGYEQCPVYKIYVDDVLVDTHSFASTGSWDSWGYYEIKVDLSTESKSIKIVAGDEIEEGFNLDYISLQGDPILDFDIPGVTEVEQYDSADFFTISTAEEFAALATNVNAGYTYEGKTVLVTADLDFSAYKDTAWTPIGTATGTQTGTGFMGHLDGRFHHFKNINMKFTENYQGLFGYMEGAVIENIIFDEGTLTAVNSRYSGILCASAKSCTIRNMENHISFVNSVEDAHWGAGFMSHCSSTTFEAIVNYGSVIGREDTNQENGGFAAWGYDSCVFRNCYMTGTVTGTSSNLIARGAGTIQNCYYLTADDTGTISKADFVSGAAAWALNTLSGAKENAGIWSAGENGPVLNPEKAVYAIQGVALDKDGNQLKELDLYVNQGDLVTVTIPGYTLKAVEQNGTALETSWIMPAQDTEGYTFQFENNTYSISYETNSGNLPEDAVMTHTSGIAQTLPLAKREGYGFKGWYDNAQLQGEPIFAVPADLYSDVTYYAAWGELVEISTAQQLASITDLSGCYILTADIDLTGVEFAPIGSKENPFVGAFDGNGYVISNLKIESDDRYQGLFGYNAGVISNVTLDDTCYISGDAHIGAIVGYNAGGVYNCITEATVAYKQPELASYKLMSQNLCMWGDGDFSVANRQPRMLDRIYANAPDIIAFQEGTEEWVNYLAQNLTGYTLLYKYRASNSLEAVPVAYKTDRFEEVESGHFWLSEKPEVESIGWDAALPRICTYVVLRDKTTGDMMALFNVHLDHAGNNARIQGGALIRERMDILLQRYPEIMLFAAGDFNCPEGSDGYNSLTGAPMADARYIADESTDLNTYCSDTTENWVNSTSSKIDFIATYEPTVHVSKFEVLAECVNGTRLSDHNGIAATYTVKTGVAIGGVVGTNDGVILQTVSNANVVGGEEAGLLIGNNRGIAENLYYAADSIDAVGSGDAAGCVECDAFDAEQMWKINQDAGENVFTVINGEPMVIGSRDLGIPVQLLVNEVPVYAISGETIELKAAGFANPVYTINGVTLEGATLTVPGEDSVVTVEEGPVIVMDGVGYFTFADANAAYAGKPMKLLADIGTAEAPAGLTQDIYVDLNGHNMYAYAEDGTNITVYGMDSTTDSFEAEEWGYLHVTGAAVASVTNNSYLAVDEGDLGWSFHAFSVKLTHVSLKPDADALGYKAQFFGDAVVQSYVTGFGFNLWVSEDRIVTKGYEKAFENGQIVTLRLKNIMAMNGGEMGINAEAFVTFSNANTVKSASHSTTMKQALETVETNLENNAAAYSADQIAAIQALISKFEGKMVGWNLDTIKAWTPVQ